MSGCVRRGCVVYGMALVLCAVLSGSVLYGSVWQGKVWINFGCGPAGQGQVRCCDVGYGKKMKEWIDTDEYTVKELLDLWNKKREGGKVFFCRKWPALVRNIDTPTPEYQKDIAIWINGVNYRLTYWPSEINEGRVRVRSEIKNFDKSEKVFDKFL